MKINRLYLRESDGGKDDQKYKRENDEKCVRKEQTMSTLDMESKNHIL